MVGAVTPGSHNDNTGLHISCRVPGYRALAASSNINSLGPLAGGLVVEMNENKRDASRVKDLHGQTGDLKGNSEENPVSGRRNSRGHAGRQAHEITISMDGKGRWVDNVFVERLWRTVKYEDLYLKAYETQKDLQRGLEKYFRYYNTQRRHTALDQRTPNAVYFGENELSPAA